MDAVGNDIDKGLADMAPIGIWAIANPDIVERLQSGTELAQPDTSTLFSGGAKGYIDYPSLQTSQSAVA